jgi:hypothetical protein
LGIFLSDIRSRTVIIADEPGWHSQSCRLEKHVRVNKPDRTWGKIETPRRLFGGRFNLFLFAAISFGLRYLRMDSFEFYRLV